MHPSYVSPFYRRIITLVGICLLIYTVFLMKTTVATFLAGFLLAYFLNPTVSLLARFMPRPLAIITVYISAGLLIFALFLWLIPLLWAQLQILWESLPAAVIWYNEVARPWLIDNTNIELLPLDSDVLSNTAINYLQTNYHFADAQGFIKNALASGLNFANNFGLVILVPILALYFLLGWQKRLNSWENALPRPYRQEIVNITKDCDEALMSFAKGQLLVMLLLGMIYAVQLELIGLKLGLIIGISSGIASFVPYLGFAVGIIAALLAGVFQFGFDWVYLGLIVGAFLVGQLIESYVLQPFLLGNKIGLSPLWVIFAVLAGASLFGFVGMLIALPVSAVLNVLFSYAYTYYKNSHYYRGPRQLQLWQNYKQTDKESR